jgi:hypothetical protein
MQERRTTRKHGPQAGIALLISIFILLLISVVAIALIVSSGTETSLAGNYRSSTGVYYAALSGLEEARGRLLGKNSGSFKSTASAGFIPSPLPMGQPVYIINPVGSEPVAPWDPASTYADQEFNQEFQPTYSLPNPSPWTNSLSTVAGVQGPLYKWVRINAVSERAIGVDVDGDGLDDTPLYYDSNLSKLVATGAGGAQQVFEITSFAVLPNGSQKTLQYLVALAPPNTPSFPSGFSFPAALTIAGPGVVFTPPASNSSYYVSGVDLTGVPSCAAGSPVDAIGVFSGTDAANVKGSIPAATSTKYDGASAPFPDVKDVSGLFPGSLQTPSQLDSLVQSISANADVSIAPAGGTAYGSDLTPWLLSGSNPSGMSSTNPLTLVVKGDLDLTGWHNTGYGLLLVTGNLNYDPDASWKGMILVIGKGTVTGSRSGTGEIDGAFFVAKTRDASGNLLPDPNLGNASVIFDPNMGSVGIRYSSCWAKAAQQTAGSLRVLSFHEIARP